MSIVEDILRSLASTSKGRGLALLVSEKARPRTFVELQRLLEKEKENTLRVTLSRLKKRGLVDNIENGWILTGQGNVQVQTLCNDVAVNLSDDPALKPKTMIIAFDIPEKQRGYRDWLRVELVALGFTAIQKSLWFGPAPLPKNFIDELGKVNLLRYIKFFKATEFDLV